MAKRKKPSLKTSEFAVVSCFVHFTTQRDKEVKAVVLACTSMRNFSHKLGRTLAKIQVLFMFRQAHIFQCVS